MKSYYWFIKEQWLVLAFGFFAVFFGNVGQTFFVGLFSASIQESLNLSASAYGLAYATATLASAVTVIWAGGLIDQVPLQRYTAFICLGLGVATALLSQSYNIYLLTISFFMLRLFGQALLPHTGTTTLARTFDVHRGKALSISASGFPVGEVILPFSAVFLINAIGWRNTYLSVSALVFMVVLPVMLSLIRSANLQSYSDSSGANEDKAGQVNVRRALLSDNRYWLALPGLMAGPFIATGVFIHQDFVISSKSWSLTWFATCFVFYGVVHWVASLLAGLLVDRFTAVKLLPFYLLPMALGLVSLSFLSGDWVAIVFLTLLGLTIGGSPPISGSLWPEIYGVNNLGTVRSINIAIMVFATAISPALYGFCIDAGISLFWITLVSAMYVVLSSGLMFLSYFKHSAPHPIAQTK